ncbi:helix-turn-helix domain-containing protein [Myxococcus sp. AM009]|uniref:helix-turn-helix domain-containing protein n=1 Tax=unclassified Myxococcus TaxID=2648731 RepID=UPI001595A6B5|nr:MULTISPECIES: helix-turn-helix domain-containing protein [unclassified Myxococcus]NVI99123.1 helix-turn-helix domain-containing protein [Myxococcus sp. AM009]NVJ14593.1 helix-turn-helix domain-containing protein [Myxococcus sp. AM010]
MPPEPPDASTVSGHLQGLARRIRALRERRGLTQEDLAARCGISVSFASLLERGERSPSYETLLQVAAALQLPLWELLRLEDTKDAGVHRLEAFVQGRGLARADVDRLLSVAEVMFNEPTPATEDLQAVRPEPVRCGEPGCEKPVLARSLCAAHYHRERRRKAASPGTGGT